MLRAVVAAHVGEAAPVGSETLTHLLPMSLSPASVRSVLAELASLELVEKPHASAGRVPTERGLRLFVDELLQAPRLAPYERRTISFSLDEAEADRVVTVASQLLSERTRMLGFVVAPRLERVALCHLSLVRLSSERLLAILVSQDGLAHRRVLEDASGTGQAELDRMAAMLNERVAGRTLPELREALSGEARVLRDQAESLLARAIALGSRAVSAEEDDRVDLVIATRLALLDQPEFRDPERLRGLFAALEAKEWLIGVLDQMIGEGGVNVAFGEEMEEPALRRCALVATRYGRDESPLGVLGVIGPSRMNFGHVIPLVGYLSHAVTEKLTA